MITQEKLKEILKYDQKTGDFIRIKKTSKPSIVGSIAGTKGKNGYIQMGINKKRYYAHRLAFLYM